MDRGKGGGKGYGRGKGKGGGKGYGQVSSSGASGEVSENKLYIGNLDSRVNEFMIIKLFKRFGKIVREEVSVSCDPLTTVLTCHDS
jgi:RNA recognition motif-containing protein